MKKPSLILGRRTPLVKNLLLIEGLSRSGKFLLANLVNGLADVEPVQYSGILEHIPFMIKFGLIDKVAGEELLHHEVDLRAYEMLIGRTLNHRISDKSSIFNVANAAHYLRRSKTLDTKKELRRFYKRGTYSLFLIHETLPELQIFFNTFPCLKVLYLQRSPVDLTYSWLMRYDIKKWGKDPTFFSIPVQGEKTLMPWYMRQYAKGFEGLSAAADKIILIMEVLFASYEKAYKAFPPRQKKNILLLRYDDILAEPHAVIKKLEMFLGKKALPGMKKILQREKLPNPSALFDGKDKKIAHLRLAASAPYFKKLMALEQKYTRAS
ncbi:MAG: sulfotransferase domain-containing protein [Minisyncoccia bacterium]|jgi:hypothetical protein